LIPLGTGCKRSGYFVDVPAPIGLDEATDQSLGMGIRKSLLPRSQLDPSFVLASRPVLWEQAEPVLPVRVDLDTSCSGCKANSIGTAHDDDVGCDLIDDFGVSQVTGDAKAINPSGVRREVTISQIDTKQVGIGRLIDEASGASEAGPCSLPGPGPCSSAAPRP